MAEQTSICYKLKNKVKKSQLKELGFVEGNKDEFTCEVTLPLNGDVVQNTIHNIYENPDWKKAFYDVDDAAKFYKETVGLEYDEKGKVKMTADFIHNVTTWNVQINFTQKILTVTSSDPSDTAVYIATVVFDSWFSELINKMKEKNLIETKGYKIHKK